MSGTTSTIPIQVSRTKQFSNFFFQALNLMFAFLFVSSLTISGVVNKVGLSCFCQRLPSSRCSVETSKNIMIPQVLRRVQSYPVVPKSSHKRNRVTHKPGLESQGKRQAITSRTRVTRTKKHMDWSHKNQPISGTRVTFFSILYQCIKQS